MREKINKFFKVVLDAAKDEFDSNPCRDITVWFSQKMQATWDEDMLFDASKTYLFAIVQANEEQRKALKAILHKQPLSEDNGCVFQIIDAIAEMLDAGETKDIMAHAKRGVNGIMWYLFNKKAAVQKSLLRYIRAEEPATSKLPAFMIRALRLFISVLQHDFPFIKNASIELWDLNFDIKDKKITPYAAALVTKAMYMERVYVPALFYAKYSLRISDPAESMEAFNTYGFCALNLSEYQLVYDIFFSWLHQKMVGLLSDVPKTFSERDSRWRSENEFKQAIIYGNMAYTCLVISRLLLPDDEKGNQFRKKALTYIRLAISFDPKQEVLFRTYAELLYDEGNYTDALGMFKRSKQYARRKLRKLTTMQRSIGVQLELLCIDDHWQESFLEEFSSKNDSKDAILSVLLDVDTLQTEIQGWSEKDFYDKDGTLSYGDFLAEIWNVGQKLEFISADDNIQANNLLSGILLCIYNTASLIRQQLRCKNYIKRYFYLRDEKENIRPEASTREQIAYYTSMDNLQFLLSKVYCDTTCERPISIADYKKKHKDSEEAAKLAEMEAKNCFTMMHAYYMNDPNEGLTLVNELSEEISEHSDLPNLVFRKLPPVVFREQLYDNQFVFLKSFTNLVDQLNMWSMYASDRKEGSDSNGCCICIAPETFDMMVKDQSDSGQLAHQASSYRDDYQLYKVAYVHNGSIVGASKQLRDYYRKMKELFVFLNRVLCKHKPKSSVDMEAIQSILQQSLAPIVFLFKDASYEAEQERRIVITRKKEMLEKISKTSQFPPKLFVNPYYQVYVEQLILGPKTKNPDHWIPYLQYELTKMWESWPKTQYGERKPIVRKSLIHYRD